MAAAASSSVRWRVGLRDLFADSFAGSSSGESCRDSRDILEVKDGRVYAWSSREQGVLALHLDQQPPQQFQCYVPTSPPIYEVHGVVCNSTVRRVALVGAKGVNVVELPRHPRHMVAAPEASTTSITNRILCSSVEIAERFFLCNPNCLVMQVKWHPDDDTSTHLVILFSNNYLRVYDCRSPATPVHVYQLGQVPVFRLSPSSVTSFGSALGETAVDFDFGRPVSAVEKFDKKFVVRVLDDQALIWPLFILRGNGDVYVMWIANPKYSMKCEVKGPLAMHPPAEDNYGVDACSIMVLPSVPHVLVIATSSGMLYHCIALETGGQNGNEDKSSELSWGTKKTSQTVNAPDVSLYVYESVELELIFGSNEENLADDETCPIRLHKDPTTMVRYHCRHNAGVHTVALPILSHLDQLTDNIAGNVEDTLSTIENQSCIVEHLICTRPLANSPPSPVIGLGIVYGQSLGGPTLLCLTVPNQLVTIPLVPTYLDKLPRLLMSVRDDASNVARMHTKEPFDQHIRMILQRKTSNPIFKSGITAESSPHDCFQLLNRSTRILREEYIEKLDLARGKIEERMKVLQDLKAQQMAELKMMTKMKEAMSIKAEDLAEKYEDLTDTQDRIMKRVEHVLRTLLNSTPMLSDAEHSMHRELKVMEEKLKHLKNSIEQVKVKRDYQASVISQHKSNDGQQQDTIGKPSGNQLKLIKDFLTEEGQTISSLIDKMKEIQIKLGL